jgi:hypothetical protein
VLVSYEECCRNPSGTLAEVCERLEIATEGALPAMAAMFRPLPALTHDAIGDPALSSRANELYAELVATPDAVGSARS